MYPPIKDYAVIGDCRSAALVSRNGSVDWFCAPSFHGASVFAALLDASKGGRLSVRPAGELETQCRRYVTDSAVLETFHEVEGGVLRVVDAMPVCDGVEGHQVLRPAHEILRQVECVDGEVEVDVEFSPRPNYARTRPQLRRRAALGIYCERGQQLVALRSDIPLRISPEGSDAHGRVRLRRGERRHVSVAVTHGEPAVAATLGKDAAKRLQRTIDWWRGWIGRCRYDGPYRDAVVRSAITLKLMTYAPSGAVVAAPTTSLPEAPGGVRNWDYRYCWLRDSTLTLQALFDLGYQPEAEAFLWWLLHTTRNTRLDPRVVYDIYGEHGLRERELDHLHGYGGAQPVRVGNAASGQLQLDNYGEVADAVAEFVSRGGRLDRQTGRLLVGLGKDVSRKWREPDAGIWEMRGSPRHHTQSKAMCWVALDRLIRLHEAGQIKAPVDDFRREKRAIRTVVERHGYSQRKRSYTATFDSEHVDASLLLLARYGYAAPRSARMLSTYRRIHEELGREGLLLRYLSNGRDGLPPGEGAFGACSFWAAEIRAQQGKIDEARAMFEYLLSLANDVGLFAEEIQIGTGDALGNFPQAFTHVGLIDAALTLDQQAGRRIPREERQQQAVTRVRL